MPFSYYGGKSKIISHYPSPIYPLIIEPFAGSGCYSLRHGKDKEVWLNDKYDIIYKIWVYLRNVTEQRIKELPHIKKGDDIRKFDLTEEEKYLIGFCVGNGRNQPGYTVTAFGDKTHYPKTDSRWRPNSTWTLTKNRILKNLEMIKDWKIINLDYKDIPNVEATWYIDPPYVNGGDRYIENKIDYNELAEWCKTRKGQVIVCENSSANWLPFEPLVEMTGSKHRTLEVIYHKIQNVA